MTDEQNKPDILVRYTRNASDTTATGALTFTDNRPDLKIGELGYVTADEQGRLAGYGVVLEPIDEAQAKELNLELPSEPLAAEEAADPNADLIGASKTKLEEIAANESPAVDLSTARNNDDRIQAIKDARAAQPEGEASLPAGSTTGVGAPDNSGTA